MRADPNYNSNPVNNNSPWMGDYSQQPPSNRPRPNFGSMDFGSRPGQRRAYGRLSRMFNPNRTGPAPANPFPGVQSRLAEVFAGLPNYANDPRLQRTFGRIDNRLGRMANRFSGYFS